MKKLAVLIAFAAVAILPAVAELQIATVNMVDLVRLHPRRSADRRLMRDTEQDYQSKLDANRKAVEDAGKKCQSLYEEIQNPMLSAAAKKSIQDKFENARNQMAVAQQTLQINIRHYQSELQDLDTRLLRAITDDIRAKTKSFAAEKKLDLIVDASMVAFAADSLDVTDGVLKLIGVSDPAAARAAAASEEDAELAAPSAPAAAKPAADSAPVAK